MKSGNMQKENKNMDKYNLKSIIQRIEKLERTVFEDGSKNNLRLNQNKETKFSGATGGIRFLVTKGYFNNKRNLADINNELVKNSYHYSLQAVQTALIRLSIPGGPLVTFKKEGRKNYAKRK